MAARLTAPEPTRDATAADAALAEAIRKGLITPAAVKVALA